jgi:hypothetical protein
MAKAETPKPAKPSKKDQYERFQQTARDLGIDEAEGAKCFEQAFEKIVPPKRSPKAASKSGS